MAATVPPQGPGSLEAAPSAYAGAVASVDGNTVRVLVPAFDSQRTHGPCSFVAPAGTPSVGDACTVVFTDAGPVVFVPGAGDTGGGSGAASFASLMKYGTD